jgi:hypothetical protein
MRDLFPSVSDGADRIKEVIMKSRVAFKALMELYSIVVNPE